jgi:GNAT superfamily N-acetyltransferase
MKTDIKCRYKRSEQQGDCGFIEKILDIDKKVFSSVVQGTFESVGGRFEANKESYILAYHNFEIVGYICFFPVTRELREKIEKEERVFDDDISSADILPYPQTAEEAESEYDIFLISIAVLPDYQGIGIGSGLMKEFFTFVSDKIQSGCKIKNLYSYAHTTYGAWLLEKSNFHELKKIENQNQKPTWLMHYSLDDFKNANMFLFVPFFVDDDNHAIDKDKVNAVRYNSQALHASGKIYDDREYNKNISIESPIVNPVEFFQEAARNIESEITGRANKTKDLTKDLCETKALCYLAQLDESSKLEFDNELSQKIERFYLGQDKFSLINEIREPIATKNFDLFVFYYRNFYVAVLAFADFSDDPTWLLDQASMNELQPLSMVHNKVDELNKTYTAPTDDTLQYKDNFKKYFAQKIGIEPDKIKQVGEIRSITSLVRNPLDIHLAYMMACERYTSTEYKLTRLTGSSFYKQALTNFAQYPFCEIYASEKNVVFITGIDDRIMSECLMLFIMELLMLQLCAIHSVYDEIISDFEEDKFSDEIINRVNHRYSSAARLWSIDNFTYLAAKKIYEETAKEFGIPRLREDNKVNLDIFEKIAGIKGQQKAAKISKRSQNFMLIFTFIAAFSAISGLFDLFISVFSERDTISLVTTIISVVLVFIMVSCYRFITKENSDKKDEKENIQSKDNKDNKNNK